MIQPDLQRISLAADFLDRMVGSVVGDVADKGAEDAVSVAGMSAVLKDQVANVAGLSDLLALAIRKLAAA